MDEILSMIGKGNLLRTKLMRIDGDIQEFISLDEYIYFHFKSLIREKYGKIFVANIFQTVVPS